MGRKQQQILKFEKWSKRNLFSSNPLVLKYRGDFSADPKEKKPQVKGERIYNGALQVQNGSSRRKPRGGGVNRSFLPQSNLVTNKQTRGGQQVTTNGSNHKTNRQIQ